MNSFSDFDSIDEKINYDKVNSIIENERRKSIQLLKKAIGDFVPIENQDKKPQYLLYDMLDPRNIAVIERAEKLLPKKSKFYADCDSKEKWAPAAYLAKLGFGDIKKLKQKDENSMEE